MDENLKEVALIIKGWYNKNKFKSSFEALTAYYHKHYGCDDYVVTKDFVCNLFLSEIIKCLLKHGTCRFSDLIDREMLSVGIDKEDAISRAKEKVERDARGFTAELINSVMNYKIEIIN